MDVELAKCECCGLKEECTTNYINCIKDKFVGKWLCGLCSEAVRDEVTRSGSNETKGYSEMVEDAVKAHVSFCRKYKSNNPACRVADGMRQMLRKRSSSEKMGSSSSTVGTTGKKYGRSMSCSQVGDESSYSIR